MESKLQNRPSSIFHIESYYDHREMPTERECEGRFLSVKPLDQGRYGYGPFLFGRCRNRSIWKSSGISKLVIAASTTI